MHHGVNVSVVVCVSSGAGTTYPSGAPEITSVLSGACVARSLDFCVVFCRSLFLLLSCFF